MCNHIQFTGKLGYPLEYVPKLSKTYDCRYVAFSFSIYERSNTVYTRKSHITFSCANVSKFYKEILAKWSACHKYPCIYANDDYDNKYYCDVLYYILSLDDPTIDVFIFIYNYNQFQLLERFIGKMIPTNARLRICDNYYN